MDLPQTLHGQLYLLAYDRTRRRFDGDNLPLFGYALRGAMLTDLYLTGHLQDRGGKSRTGFARPRDRVLRDAFDQIDVTPPTEWADWITEHHKGTAQIVRDQLEEMGWLHVERRRRLGVIPNARYHLCDDDMVAGLAHRVTAALLNAIDGRDADPWPLAVGLLGVLGQMPTVFSRRDCARYRQELHQLILAACAPISGLHKAIAAHHEELRRSMIDNGAWGP